MSNKQIPFYTQAAILERYIRKPQIDIDSEIIKVIVEMLQKNSELRAYFFRNRPHSDWAKTLWDNGFLNKPPKVDEEDKFLPHWDAQNFLISVAEHVPDIVVNHVNVLDKEQTRDWYLSRAVTALSKIDLEYIEQTIPQLFNYLDSNYVDRTIFDYIYEIMIALAKAKRNDIAFRLFQELTQPVIKDNKPENLLSYSRPGAKCDSALDKRRNWGELKILEGLDPNRLISILEDHLRIALLLEETDPENKMYSETSFWRSSIEDTDQNAYLDYKETILDALRDSIHSQLEISSQDAIEKVKSYLTDEYMIMNRIGVHFVRLFPQIFHNELETILLDSENFDNLDIHHEFFLLLRDGIQYLENEQKNLLTEIIFAGPPEEHLAWLSESAENHFSKGIIDNENDWIENQVRRWKYNRLWMINDHLVGDNKELFQYLLTEFGEPDHPTFTHYSTGVMSIVQISPVSREELERLNPSERIEFARNWTPENDIKFWPYERSYAGLGAEIANLLFENPEKNYREIVELGTLKPGYASAIFNIFSDTESPTSIIWEIIIDLSSAILSEDFRRYGKPSQNDDDWFNVRIDIARILSSGLRHKDKRIPSKLYGGLKEILEILVYDPDPDIERDQPPEGYLGHDDPITLSLNAVRPIALNALITCHMELFKLANPEFTGDLGKSRMDKELKTILEEKLDTKKEPSQSVRSVFGGRLINLVWLDANWVRENIDRIFPENDDETSKKLFVSAISSFVIQRNYYHDLLPILKPKYEKAIEYFSRGYIIKTHLQLLENFAGHLLWEYIASDYKFEGDLEDSDILIIKFFRSFDGNGRQAGAFICRRILDSPTNVEEHWSKIRKIWEWRTQEAVQAGHTSDFDGEMLSFARLVEIAPESETLKSLWPLLNSTVPHLQSIEYRDHGWDAIENYLAKNVDSEPLLAIQLYLKMYDQASPPRWLAQREEARKIIETAANQEESKEIACDLINLIGSRLGDDQFKDIFEKNC